MKNTVAHKLATCILAAFLIFALSALLPTAALAANADETAYGLTLEEVRNAIREEPIIIGRDGYPSKDISECAYTFYDIDENGINELIITTEGGTAFIYTLSGGESVLLARWAGYRDFFREINERGYMIGGGSTSASSGGTRYVRIAADGKSVEVTEVLYELAENDSVRYTLITPDGRERNMSRSDIDSYLKTNISAPAVALSDWKTLTDQSGKTAHPSISTVLVNGRIVAFDAYNINDNNYFKLRDLAYTLSGSEKQFDLDWDAENNAISLIRAQPYTPVGGEMTGKGADARIPVLTSSKIYLDGREVSFTAYHIEGNNYFKLRDIAEAFDFGVSWIGTNNTIAIDTGTGYLED